MIFLQPTRLLQPRGVDVGPKHAAAQVAARPARRCVYVNVLKGKVHARALLKAPNVSGVPIPAPGPNDADGVVAKNNVADLSARFGSAISSGLVIRLWRGDR